LRHGGHSILIGQVLRGLFYEDICPLLYVDGAVARLAALKN